MIKTPWEAGLEETGENVGFQQQGEERDGPSAQMGRGDQRADHRGTGHQPASCRGLGEHLALSLPFAEEAQRGEMLCSRPHSKLMAEWGSFKIFSNIFNFPVIVDIQYYTGFKCTA